MKNKIKFYFNWVLYWLITVNERTEYLKALERGYDCIHSHDDSTDIYGRVRKYYFDKSKPPTRRYLTFKEYKNLNYVAE